MFNIGHLVALNLLRLDSFNIFLEELHSCLTGRGVTPSRMS